MSEFRRIFFSRRMFITWLIGLFLCCTFFFYECGSTNQITLTGEELNQFYVYLRRCQHRLEKKNLFLRLWHKWVFVLY